MAGLWALKRGPAQAGAGGPAAVHAVSKWLLKTARAGDEIATAEVKRLREVQEGQRKTASLLGDFIRMYKKAVASQ